MSKKPATPKTPTKKKPLKLSDLKAVFSPDEMKRFADGARFIYSK